MARKKKTPAVEKKETVSYQGNIKVSVQKGKKTLSSKTYHNAGTTNLFKFICEALAGNFRSGLKPSKIVLFTAAGESADNEASWQFLSARAISPMIAYDTTALAEIIETDTDVPTAGYKVTYTFKIPANYVFGDKIYKVALYGSDAVDVPSSGSGSDQGRSNTLAYFGFTAKDNTEIVWDPMSLESTDANLSILFEWTLSVQNK